MRGPLSVYYQDRLEQAIGALPDGALGKRDELLADEALKLAGRVGLVSVEEVAGWLEIVERAKVIRWKD